MKKDKIYAVIVGCGNIARAYAQQIRSYPHIVLTGFQDLAPERSSAFATEFGGRAYATLEEVLADPAIDLVVNLTIHHAHAEVIRKCLAAGKHVHTEKPLALSYKDAAELVDLAKRAGLRLSSAPITYMGEAQQTAWNLLREGRTGPVRLVYAEVNHGRIELWHPNPEPFYDVGIIWDVGVYPLTLLTTFFGPALRVTGLSRFLHRERVTKEGRPFTLTTPDFGVAILEFENGVTARFSANFYAKGSKQGGSLEFHGDLGRVYLENFQNFGAAVEFGLYGEPYESVPLLRPRKEGVELARGVDELARSLLDGRPQRAQGAQAAHVIEIVEAIGLSEGRPIDIISRFVPPEPVNFGELHPFSE